MYGIYANIRGILMVNVTIYSIHGSYGLSVCLHVQPFWLVLSHIWEATLHETILGSASLQGHHPFLLPQEN